MTWLLFMHSDAKSKFTERRLLCKQKEIMYRKERNSQVLLKTEKVLSGWWYIARMVYRISCFKTVSMDLFMFWGLPIEMYDQCISWSFCLLNTGRELTSTLTVMKSAEDSCGFKIMKPFHFLFSLRFLLAPPSGQT